MADKEKKNLEKGEGDLEKRDIKERLDRIETEMEKGKKFTIWSVFGGFFIASGLGVIGFSIRHDPIATVSGVCMLVVGGVILSTCFIKFKRI